MHLRMSDLRPAMGEAGAEPALRLSAVEATLARAQAITKPLAGSPSQNEAMRRELAAAWRDLSSEALRYAAGPGAKRTGASADFLAISKDADAGAASLASGKPTWSELDARNAASGSQVAKAAAAVRSRTSADLVLAQAGLRAKAALLSLVPASLDPTGERGLIVAANALVADWRAIQKSLAGAVAADEISDQDAARVASGQREVRSQIEAKVSEVSGALSNAAESACSSLDAAGIACEPGSGRLLAAWVAERKWWLAGGAAVLGWLLLRPGSGPSENPRRRRNTGLG